jgi:DNA-binding transcriptional LysR family regulator
VRSLNLDQLKAFIEVAERGSFTAAAKALNLSQPAVTHQVHELEQRFQIAFLERLGKRAHLTEAGEKLMEHARHLLAEDARTREAMRKFADGWLGRVRIGTSMTILMYALPPLLRQLKTSHPQLDITLKSGLTATTLRLLKDNQLDLGLCAMPVTDPAFETVPLFRDELVAIFPGTHKNIPKTVTPSLMAQCPLILGNRQSALRRAVEDWLAPAQSMYTVVMEFDNVDAIKNVVAVGLGSSIVPRLALPEGHMGVRNISIRSLKPRLTRPVALVKLRGKRPTEAVSLVSTALLSLRRRYQP